MAITYITGIPRSGKSYYAMYLLYKSFIYQAPKSSKFQSILNNFLPKKTLDKHYEIAYTNINQFDFTQSDKIKPFCMEELRPILENLHQMYVIKKTDLELIEEAKKDNLVDALFVIDEAHNFFGKEDEVLTWWLTYHGHLHQDIILITQNLDYIFSRYAKTAEFFYKAVPPSSRLFSNKFRYIQYNSHKLYKVDRIGDFHVPILPDIFKMYVSGAENNAKSAVKKYLLIGAVLFVIVLLLFKNFLSLFDVAPKDTNTTKEDKNTSLSSSIPPAYDLAQHKQMSDSKIQIDKRDTTTDELFNIRCFDMLCNYKGTDFPKPLFNKLTKKLSPDFIWFFQNSTFTDYYVMLPSDTFDFLQIQEKKDKKDAVQNPKVPKATDVLATTHK